VHHADISDHTNTNKKSQQYEQTNQPTVYQTGATLPITSPTRGCEEPNDHPEVALGAPEDTVARERAGVMLPESQDQDELPQGVAES
jgi:hypothetical protein